MYGGGGGGDGGGGGGLRNTNPNMMLRPVS